MSTKKRRTQTKRTQAKRPAKKTTARKVVSFRYAVLAGLSLLVFGLVLIGWEFYNTWRAQQAAASSVPISQLLNNKKDDNQSYISGVPVQIFIPSVAIDLKVIPGYYYQKSNSWTLTTDKAQWGTITKQPNDGGGMTFIYAHYRKGVFLKLPKIKPGEFAQIKTDKGHTFTYVFRSSTITTPTDTSIFAYQGDPILILQTCTGAWYQNRQLFLFDLVKVE